MSSDIFDQWVQLRNSEEPFVLATVVAYKSPQSAKPGSKAIIKSDGSIIGWVGSGCVQPIVVREAMRALETGKPKLLSISPELADADWEGIESYRMTCEGGGSLEIFLEPVLPKPQLFIVGRSPVAEMVSELGGVLGFKVCLADPQGSREQFPNVDLILTDLSLVRSRIYQASFVVVATMGNGDEEGLQAVVGSTPRYLGLVASEKKAESLFEYLRENGATDEQIAAIKCPAGLQLGGETIPEIALSVMAEITQIRRASGSSTKSVEFSVMSEPAQDEAHGTAFDPICGMTVDVQSARYTSVFEDTTVYFCGLRCKETFDRTSQDPPQISQTENEKRSNG